MGLIIARPPSAAIFRSGLYYALPDQPINGSQIGNQTFAAGWLLAVPWLFPHAFTINLLGIRVSTAAASSFVRPGIWADNNGVPGVLLADTGQIDASTTGAKEAAVSVPVSPGRYWLGCVSQGGTPAVACYPAGIFGVGADANTGAYGGATAPANGALVTGVTGTLPNPFGTAGWNTGTAPRVYFRVA